ncbi:MAG TPA: prolyl oligopeptidase family serine peptidase [Chloroflexi bacterium]|nr:prolyl oligopeptidase family serine peptidase [Chloroflexota bacterium]
MRKSIFKKHWLLITVIILTAALFWFLTTDNVKVWPLRNTLQYHLLTRWWGLAGEPQSGQTGVLSGNIHNEAKQPIAGAWVLLSRWDGKTYQTRSASDGSYTINGVPAGRYMPVFAAPGYAKMTVGRVKIDEGEENSLNITLTAQTPPQVSPGTAFHLSQPSNISCDSPVKSEAVRQELTFDDAGQANQQTFYYTPITATKNSRLPLLIAVYPGPADTWECASVPLAAQGFAVLGIGPEYSLDPERDVDQLERLRLFARNGLFPGVDPEQIALLGGSYSALHVMLLLQRQPAHVNAAIILGPPTDLFEMRHQLELGNFTPPFGLDKVMVAMGFPDQEPMHYWPYSGAYHLPPSTPPLLIIHSRHDEVVPYQQSELLAANLKLDDIPYELHLTEGDSHYLMSDTGDSREVYRMALDFLKANLKK